MLSWALNVQGSTLAKVQSNKECGVGERRGLCGESRHKGLGELLLLRPQLLRLATAELLHFTRDIHTRNCPSPRPWCAAGWPRGCRDGPPEARAGRSGTPALPLGPCSLLTLHKDQLSPLPSPHATAFWFQSPFLPFLTILSMCLNDILKREQFCALESACAWSSHLLTPHPSP